MQTPDTNPTPAEVPNPAPVYTPPAIKGYRKLTQEELDSVNYVKTVGENIESAIKTLDAANHGLEPRALALAKASLQQGLMWLTHSITKPETFA